MNHRDNESAENEQEVLVEKDGEIEAAKIESENFDDKNNTAKILNEKRILTAPMSDAEAKKNMSQRRAGHF